MISSASICKCIFIELELIRLTFNKSNLHPKIYYPEGPHSCPFRWHLCCKLEGYFRLPDYQYSMKFFINTAILLWMMGHVSAQSFYKEQNSRDNILTIGLGPSFAYIDNGGQYRDLNFKIKPSVSIGWTKRFTDSFFLRATTGIQWITNGGDPSPEAQNMWRLKNASFTAKGRANYFDLMPGISLISFGNHMSRSLFNLYGGLGIGILTATTQQTKSFNRENAPFRQVITTGYIPVRAGLSYRLGPYSDISGEGTMLLTFTDNLDGNVGSNLYADHLFQAQIVFRRYFSTKMKNKSQTKLE